MLNAAAIRAVLELLSGRGEAFIWPAEVHQIVRDFEIEADDDRPLRQAVWHRLVLDAASDTVIDEAEVRRLDGYRRALDISEDEVLAVEHELLHPVLRGAIDDALADRVLTTEEQNRVREAADRLGISRMMADHLTRSAQDTLRDSGEQLGT